MSQIQFQQEFHHFAEHRVVVCKQCHYAIPPSHFKGHINKHHNHYTPATRKRMIEWLQAIPDIATNIKDIIHPLPGSRAVPYIDIHKDGRKCIACGHMSRGKLYHMQNYCHKKHSWENKVQRGRPSIISAGPAQEQPWVEGIHCQMLFKAPQWKKIIQVREEVEEVERQNASFQHIETRLEEIEKIQEEARKKELVDAVNDESRFEAMGWLKVTQWPSMLHGRDRQWLQGFIRPVDMLTEGRTARVCRSIRRVIEKAQKNAQVNVVGRTALQMINAKHFGGDDERVSGKIMGTEQLQQTMRKYGDVFIKIILYTCRMYKVEQEEDLSSEEEDEEETEEGTEGGDKAGHKRPAFIVTDQQSDALDRMFEFIGLDWDAPDSEGPDKGPERESKEVRKQLDELVLDVLIALLDQKTGDIAGRSILVTALAVMGISQSSGWISPLLYTPVLSAVATIGRMLVISHAVRLRRAEVKEIQERDSISAKRAETRARDHHEFVEELADRFMRLAARGKASTPMNYVFYTRTYGFTVRYNTTAPGYVDWKRDTIMYGSIQFSILELRAMVHGMVHELQEAVCQMVLQPWVARGVGMDPYEKWWKRHRLPRIEWHMLVDDPSEMRRDWNFLKDNRNKAYLRTGKRYIMKKIFGDEKLTQGYFNISRSEETGIEYTPKRKKMEDYFERMEEFREKLLVLVHICSGAPARGTEIITTRYKNSKTGAGRGIFIENGMIAYVTGYHKGYGMSAMLKIIHRYMPLEVGELLVYYMWLIQPFWAELRGLAGDISEDSPYLWPPKEEELKMGGKIGEVEEWEDMGAEEAQQRIRQRQEEEDDVAAIEEIGIDELVEEEEDEENRLVMQADLKTKGWTSSRVGQVMMKATGRHLKVKIPPLSWRHICIAFMRKYIKDGSVQRALSDENPNEMREEQFGIAAEDDNFNYGRFVDEMAGHTAMIAAMNYARSNQEAFGVIHTRREAYRRISKAWHELLAFASALVPGQMTRERGFGEPAAWVQQAEEGQMQRWAWTRAMNLESQLKIVAGHDAKFRSVQRPALEAIVGRVSPVVVVMGTGAGKSMLFMLPATYRGSVMEGITVLIVPTISLRKDMARRCEQMGIDCVVWNASHPQEWASVIIVVPETAVHEVFISFMSKMRQMGRLDRIVIDEAHTVLDTEHGWRLKMLDMRKFIALETQLVYLTATLPPGKIPSFKKITGIETAGPGAGAWFRGRTVRSNIGYSVRKYSRRDDDATMIVQSVVDEMLVKYEAPTKIIIYCGGMIKEVEELAKGLGAICYHRKVGTDKEKDNIVNVLIEGEARVFVATNALGVGIDSPLIRVVIHVGRLHKLRDYAQESGRAGRDGSKSEAVILHAVNTDRQGREIEDGMKQWAEPEMVQFIYTKECRRVVMDRVMDGDMGRVSCIGGEERCDVCMIREERVLDEMASQQQAQQIRLQLERQGEGEDEGREEGSRNGRRRGHSRLVSQQDTIEMTARSRITEKRSQDFRVEYDTRVEMEMASQQQKMWARNERSQVMSNEEECTKMISCLEQWKQGCILCRVIHEDVREAETHRLGDCKEEGAERFRYIAKQEEQKMRNKKAWDKYIGCMGAGCGVPFQICKSWKEKEGGERYFERTSKKGWKCQYKGILMRAVLAMYQTMEEVRVWVADEIHREELEGVELVMWFGRRQSIGGMQSNRMMEVFMRFEGRARERDIEEVEENVDEERQDEEIMEEEEAVDGDDGDDAWSF